MNTEEKARAYDEALERAKQVLSNNCTEVEKLCLECIFPELAKSEDERIRKSVIGFLKTIASLKDGKTVSNEDSDALLEWASYLEKQKEPLPIPDKFSGLKSLMLQYLQSAANRKDDAEIEDDTDLFGRKILDYVWKYDEKQKEQKPVEWKPLPESMEALMLAIEGEWEAIKPTGYMSRRLEDLYDGLVNTFDVDEKYLDNLPRTAYTTKDNQIDPFDTKLFQDGVKEGRRLEREDMQKELFSCGHENGNSEKPNNQLSNEAEDDKAPRWKPSEEQMKALRAASSLSSLGEYVQRHLWSLYEQLKKLGVKEEPEYYQHFDPDC